MRPLPRSFFAGDAVELAPKLLGKIVRLGSCTGIIVETEAYTIDGASHAAKGGERGRLMRETHGHWYVYFTYGMHWCANVTTNEGGTGAVLIRAVEPLEGIAEMQKRRARSGRADLPLRALANGPAKFCQTVGLNGKKNDKPRGGEFALYHAP